MSRFLKLFDEISKKEPIFGCFDILYFPCPQPSLCLGDMCFYEHKHIICSEFAPTLLPKIFLKEKGWTSKQINNRTPRYYCPKCSEQIENYYESQRSNKKSKIEK